MGSFAGRSSVAVEPPFMIQISLAVQFLLLHVKSGSCTTSAACRPGCPLRVARADLAGLDLAQIPAALLKCASMCNPDEAALVSTPAGRARYATAVAAGILGWLASGRQR